MAIMPATLQKTATHLPRKGAEMAIRLGLITGVVTAGFFIGLLQLMKPTNLVMPDHE